MRDHGIYRAHVWKDSTFTVARWVVGIWKDGSGVTFPADLSRIVYRTQPEALAAGLAWAGELNAREAAER